MPGMADPVAVVVRFNDCITVGDVDELTGLMTFDHVFIDTVGHAVHGRNECRRAWQRFFDAFPGYRNVFTSLTATGPFVTMTGFSECSVVELAGPALWAATVRADRVAGWQVYLDTPANREALALPRDDQPSAP